MKCKIWFNGPDGIKDSNYKNIDVFDSSKRLEDNVELHDSISDARKELKNNVALCESINGELLVDDRKNLNKYLSVNVNMNFVVSNGENKSSESNLLLLNEMYKVDTVININKFSSVKKLVNATA